MSLYGQLSVEYVVTLCSLLEASQGEGPRVANDGTQTHFLHRFQATFTFAFHQTALVSGKRQVLTIGKTSAPAFLASRPFDFLD